MNGSSLTLRKSDAATTADTSGAAAGSGATDADAAWWWCGAGCGPDTKNGAASAAPHGATTRSKSPWRAWNASPSREPLEKHASKKEAGVNP